MAVYTDFAITISLAPAGYSVQATAPTGRAQTNATLPLSPLELENRLQAVELSLLRGRGGLRRALSESERQAQELGQILFDFLFNGDSRALFDLNRLESERQETPIRLLLTVEPPELAALPWELLYHSREGEFLALSQSTPVIRYAAAPYAQNALTVTPPLRVLGIVAAPNDWENLDIAQEKQRLEEALAPLQQNQLAELVWLEGQTRRDLQRAMRTGPWHVIHFIGHGGFDQQREEGYIVLCDETGAAAHLYAVELARLVADHPSLRLTFLNACEGAAASQSDDLASSAAALVRRSVPAVVAMQYPISDAGAIEFARTFYESLADNLPVEAAVTDARKSVSLAVPHSPEWATPVLFLSSQDGRLFALEKASPAAPSTPQPPLPQDDVPPVSKQSPAISRYLWLFTLLAILAFAAWQGWPRQKDENTPTPAATIAVIMPSAATATSQPTLTTAIPSSPIFSQSTPDPSALLQVSFDDAESIRLPLTGPAGVVTLPDVAFGPGHTGNGLRFGAQRGIVAFPLAEVDPRPLDFAQGELEFWYQPAYDHDPTSDTAYALVNAGDWWADIQLRLAVIGRLTFSIFDDSSTSVGARTGLARSLWKAGEWVHIRAVWDASRSNDPIQLYVNGERVDTDRSLRTWQVVDEQLPKTLYIGGASDEGILSADGVIDDLVIRAKH